MAFGFAIDVFLFCVAVVLTVYFRRQITSFFRKIPLPRFLLYLLSALPFIIFEEFINCITCFPWTILWLLIVMVLLGLIVTITRTKRYAATLIVFAICGFVFETFISDASAVDPLSLSPFMLLFMTFWVGLSYAFIAIIPLRILINKNNEEKKKKSVLLFGR